MFQTMGKICKLQQAKNLRMSSEIVKLKSLKSHKNLLARSMQNITLCYLENCFFFIPSPKINS